MDTSEVNSAKAESADNDFLRKKDNVGGPQQVPADNTNNRGEKHKSGEDLQSERKKRKVENKNIKTQNHKDKRQDKKYTKNQGRKKITEAEGVVTALNLTETRYIFKNGLRHVIPYYFDFEVDVKGRWINRELLELYSTEFSQLPKKVYEAKIKRGDILVNGDRSTTDYKVQLHDIISHRVHRHEPPVSLSHIPIIYANDEFLVVNKPGSLPVHPCGRFRHNSLLFVLAHEQGETNLYTVNRLDRLTSGLLVLARTSEIAARLSKQISSNLVQKQYLARVVGEFPEGEVVVDQPLKIINIRQGINHVSPDGKESKTIFVRWSYDKESNTSIVLCKPVTGRTHQIRIHLQYIGHPITNDPIYNNDPAVNKLGGLTSDGNSLPKFLDDDDEMFSPATQTENNNTTTTTTTSDTNNNENNENTENKENGSNNNSTKGVDPECSDCNTIRTDPKPEDMFIYLHAYSYKGPDWSFETELPPWARDSAKQTK